MHRRRQRCRHGGDCTHLHAGRCTFLHTAAEKEAAVARCFWTAAEDAAMLRALAVADRHIRQGQHQDALDMVTSHKDTAGYALHNAQIAVAPRFTRREAWSEHNPHNLLPIPADLGPMLSFTSSAPHDVDRVRLHEVLSPWRSDGWSYGDFDIILDVGLFYAVLSATPIPHPPREHSTQCPCFFWMLIGACTPMSCRFMLILGA